VRAPNEAPICRYPPCTPRLARMINVRAHLLCRLQPSGEFGQAQSKSCVNTGACWNRIGIGATTSPHANCRIALFQILCSLPPFSSNDLVTVEQNDLLILRPARRWICVEPKSLERVEQKRTADRNLRVPVLHAIIHLDGSALVV
jgi:hypothetical protein